MTRSKVDRGRCDEKTLTRFGIEKHVGESLAHVDVSYVSCIEDYPDIATNNITVDGSKSLAAPNDTERGVSDEKNAIFIRRRYRKRKKENVCVERFEKIRKGPSHNIPLSFSMKVLQVPPFHLLNEM